MNQSYRVYTETYIVLKTLNLLHDLPQNSQKLITQNYDKRINFIYDGSIPIEYQNLSKDTRTYLTYLYIKYFCKSSDERKQYQVIIAENTKRAEMTRKKIEEEKRELYNLDDIFKNKREKPSLENNQEISENNANTMLIEYKQSFFTKFKNFLFEILHITKKID